MAIIIDNGRPNTASVTDDGLLMVGLDGFTIQDLADQFPGIQIGIHVKDGDKWVSVKLEDLKR